MLDVIKDKDILDLLYVKSSKDRLVQYRNIFRFEAYSEIAVKRLRRRLAGEFKSYREEVFRIVDGALITDRSGRVTVRLCSAPTELISSVRLEKIKSKLEIKASFYGNDLSIEGDNPVMLSRFLLFILCDCIDTAGVFEVLMPLEIKELCKAFFESRIKLERSIKYLGLTTPCEKLLGIIGAEYTGDGEIIPEPYRSDIVNGATLINDMLSAEVTFFKNMKRVPEGKESFSAILSAERFQENLLGAGFEFSGELFPGEGDIDDFIITCDKNRRDAAFPHSFYSFVSSGDILSPTEVVMWHAGHGIDINSFAETARRVFTLSLIEDMDWDEYGERLTARRNGEKRAEVYLIDGERIGKFNSNVYKIAVARIRL